MLRRKNYPIAVGLRMTKDDYRAARAERRRDEAISDTLRRLIRAGLESVKTMQNTQETAVE